MFVPLAALLVAISGLDECGRINEYNENNGWTALHRSAVKADIKCIQYLLEMGAEPNDQSLKGSTALHMVVKHRNDQEVYNAVELLLKFGANIELEDQSGQQAVQHVYRNLWLMEDTKLTLTQMMAEKGQIARQMSNVNFSILGVKIPFLPAPPIWWSSPWLSTWLEAMDEEEDITAKKITDMEYTIKKQNMELAESKEKVKAMREAAEMTLGEKGVLSTEVDNLKMELSKTKKELSAKSDLVETLSTKNEDDNDLLNQALADFNKCTDDAHISESTISDQLVTSASQTAEIAELNAQVTTEKEKSKSLENSVSELRAELETLTSQIDQLSSSATEAATSNENILKLNSDISLCRENLKREKQKVSENSESVEKLERDVHYCNEERLEDKSKYHFEIETIRVEKAKCTDSLDEKTEEVKALQKSTVQVPDDDSCSSELARVTGDLETKNEEIEKFRKAESIAKARESTKMGLKTCNTENVEKLKAEIEELTKEKRIIILTIGQITFGIFVVYSLSKCCGSSKTSIASDLVPAVNRVQPPEEVKKLNEELLMERERRMNVEKQNQVFSANLVRLQTAAEESFEIQNMLSDRLETTEEISAIQGELDHLKVGCTASLSDSRPSTGLELLDGYESDEKAEMQNGEISSDEY